MKIINDTHLGVLRNAGTTPRSSYALRQEVQEKFRCLVEGISEDLCILGDLFDQYNVPNSDLIEAFTTLSRWCKTNNLATLHLVAGNHDLSKDSSRLSSFEVLCQLLQHVHKNIQVHMTPGWAGDESGGIWIIPHCVNQDVFDLDLARVPTSARFVLLHANYNNFHAEQADHSLNVSEAQALKLVEQGATLVFAHEHQHRMALDCRVVVIGNQIPTSVADCLGVKEKYMLSIGEDGYEIVPVLRMADVFERVFERRDWRNLGVPPLSKDTRFIRVEGEAATNEAADVVTAISKYRSKSDAFVITNAVKVEGVQELKDLPETLESAKAFDVLSAILEVLDDREREVVKTLLKESTPC